MLEGEVVEPQRDADAPHEGGIVLADEDHGRTPGTRLSRRPGTRQERELRSLIQFGCSRVEASMRAEVGNTDFGEGAVKRAGEEVPAVPPMLFRRRRHTLIRPRVAKSGV